jgi:hypothetical protein
VFLTFFPANLMFLAVFRWTFMFSRSSCGRAPCSGRLAQVSFGLAVLQNRLVWWSCRSTSAPAVFRKEWRFFLNYKRLE